MAKKATVEEKYAGPKGKMGIKVENPPPPKEPAQKDVDFIGEELVKLSKRMNELELSLEEMRLRLRTVSGRMGL